MECDCGIHNRAEWLDLRRNFLQTISESAEQPSTFLRWWDDKGSKAYSDCELTYSKDRLPALARIVQQISPHVRGGRCIAAIWEAALPGALCWVLDDPTGRFTAPSYPTWSCLSRTGARRQYGRLITSHSWDVSQASILRFEKAGGLGAQANYFITAEGASIMLSAPAADFRVDRNSNLMMVELVSVEDDHLREIFWLDFYTSDPE